MSIKTVMAYECSKCSSVFREEGEAEACCTCTHCGKKMDKRSFRTRCAHCSYGADLREARKDVKRTEERLESAKKRLERLLKEGKPA